MCDSPLRALADEVSRLGREFTLPQKVALHEAFIRDSRLTFGEELAKLTALSWEDESSF